MTEIKRLFDIPLFQLNNFDLPIAFVTKYHDDWQSISSKDYVDNANSLSRSLIDLGVKPNDKIAIITERTRTEWNITDIGIMQVGAQSVPIYDSTSSNETKYILNHAEVKYCFVSNEQLFNKINDIKEDTPFLEKIISFDKIDGCTSLNDLISHGSALKNQEEVEFIKKAVRENDLATIIYTSGTTDKPKGVMLSHSNIISNILASQNRLPIINGEAKSLSFLPVSHIFERMMLYLYQYNGFSIYYAESIETISSDLAYVKPHVITVVPRLLEKIHDRIIAKGNELNGIKKRLFNWAIELGYRYEPYGKNGKKYERNLSRARKLVFKKWQEALGGNIKVMFCGSAILQPRLARIFCAAELYVMDGYGLTETSPVISVNSTNEGFLKIGTIGKPLNNVEVIIAKDGEILVKGPNVMLGYYKDQEKTEASIIKGYFHTGDLGKIDSNGFLSITGRKKENFKTSGGKYINPGIIENELKKSPFIERVMVIGESEKMPAAIIQPNFELIIELVKSSEITLEPSRSELIKHTIVLDKIQTEIDMVNESLSQWEKIKRFELTKEEWTTEDGHLTPTLKVRRDIIKSKYYILYNKIYRPFS